MPKWLNLLLTTVASGAVTGFAGCVTTGGPVNWAHCGSVAAVGAAVGVINLARQSPIAPTQ